MRCTSPGRGEGQHPGRQECLRPVDLSHERAGAHHYDLEGIVAVLPIAGRVAAGAAPVVDLDRIAPMNGGGRWRVAEQDSGSGPPDRHAYWQACPPRALLPCRRFPRGEALSRESSRTRRPARAGDRADGDRSRALLLLQRALRSHRPGPQTTVALFFTRWVTHFCAPVFMLLAGAGAYLSLGRGPHPGGRLPVPPHPRALAAGARADRGAVRLAVQSRLRLQLRPGFLGARLVHDRARGTGVAPALGWRRSGCG